MLKPSTPGLTTPLAVHRGGADVAVHSVVKSFGPIEALRGVSLKVATSEFVAITGPSGSGKSTLLNLIGSLDRPDCGTITVAGAPVPDPHHAVGFRHQVVGFVFQDNLLLPLLSAQANVEAALLAAGVGRSERHRRSAELLAEVGLADRVHLPPPSSRADSGRRSHWRARSPTTRACYWPTSQRERSTQRVPSGRSTCSRRCARSTA